MARFNAAKMGGATDTTFQRMYNMLIDLLDSGYSTTATINGKIIKVDINPQTGITITVNGDKAFGVDSSGNVYVQRISNITDNRYYAEFGYGENAGLTMYMPGDLGGSVRYLNITPTVDGGFMFVDSNARPRFEITADGSFSMWDASANKVLYISNDGNFSQLHTASLVDNAIGVDDTGGYIVVGGVKMYLTDVYAPAPPEGEDYVTSDDVLTLTNTTEFTPDADYEPATKKYVDDSTGGGASKAFAVAMAIALG